MFTDEFLESLPPDHTEALLRLCKEFQIFNSNIPDSAEVQKYDEYLEAYAAFEAFVDAYELEFPVPTLEERQKVNIHALCSYVNVTVNAIEKTATNEKFSIARNHFRARFGGGFIYEFSDGDLSRIQILLNELRDEVARSELFDAKHKQRVLNKVESLQRELHKKITSLDKLWGLIGEAGVALGKFGSNAKPFVDRIKEIAQITWRTQARAEELPSGTTLPLLTSSDAEERDDA